MGDSKGAPGSAGPRHFDSDDRCICLTPMEAHWVISALHDAQFAIPPDHPDYGGIRFAVELMRERRDESINLQ